MNQPENLNPDEQEIYNELQNELTTPDSISSLLDNIIKYYIFYNGCDEVEESDKWKQLLDKQKTCPDHIHKLVEQSFIIKLKTIIKKEKQDYKTLNK